MCNGCNGVSLGDHGVPEGNCIPSLKSHGKALEQESGFPGVFCGCSDASADLLCHYYHYCYYYYYLLKLFYRYFTELFSIFLV